MMYRFWFAILTNTQASCPCNKLFDSLQGACNVFKQFSVYFARKIVQFAIINNKNKHPNKSVILRVEISSNKTNRIFIKYVTFSNDFKSLNLSSLMFISFFCFLDFVLEDVSTRTKKNIRLMTLFI